MSRELLSIPSPGFFTHKAHLAIEPSAGRTSSSFSMPLLRILVAIVLASFLPGVKAQCWIDDKYVTPYPDFLYRRT